MKIVYFIFLFYYAIVFAQQGKECKLAEDNLLWKIKFKKTESLNEKLDLINDKIKYDAFFIEKDTIWTNSLIADKITTETQGKPLICVFSNIIILDSIGNTCSPKMHFYMLDNKNLVKIDLYKEPNLNWICNELNTFNVSDIQLIDDEKVSAFGSGASEGVILIRLKDKKIIKKIKKQLKQNSRINQT